MANLYIGEAERLWRDGTGHIVPVFPGPPVASQKVSFTTATQSAAFNSRTRVLRLYADAACHIAFGSNPTATASSERFAADTEYFRAVQPSDKLSVYDGSS